MQGKSELIKTGSDVTLLAVGNMVDYSKQAAEMLGQEGIHAEVINMRFIKPLDTEKLDDIAKRYEKIITLEENSIVGGFGTGVLEYFAGKGYKNDILNIGLPDKFIDHGTQKELHAILGIDPKGIADKTKIFLNKKNFNKGVAV